MWYLISIGLAFIAFVIYVFPSGPLCLTCKKYFTDIYKFKAHNPSKNITSNIEITFCFSCKKNINILVDGIKKHKIEDIYD